MSERTLAIFDEEEAYVEALSGYLNKNRDTGFVVSAFSDRRKMTEYLKSDRSEYVLTSEAAREEAAEIVGEDRVISLLEAREDIKKGPWVYKYQSAKAIAKELNAILLTRAEEMIVSGNSIQVVFSTKSGIEREEYVNLLLTDLAGKGSVLYVNLEPFIMGKREPFADGRGMSELIYYIKQGGENLRWKFKSLIEKRGISGNISQVSRIMDIYEFSKEDVKVFISLLKDCVEYDTILINMGFFNEAALELIKAACHIELVVTRKEGDRESAERLIDQLELMRISDIRRRIEIVEFGTDTWL